jgi:hypothetical protein
MCFEYILLLELCFLGIFLHPENGLASLAIAILSKNIILFT